MEPAISIKAISASLVRLGATPAQAQCVQATSGDPSAGHRGSGETGSSRDGAIELLRLGVPAAHRPIWLAAERAVWEPWLLRQPGFLGRELFWDPVLEHGVLMIRWASRRRWHAISADEVSKVHQTFQQHARELLLRAGLRLEGEDPVSGAPDCFPLLLSSEVEPELPHPMAG